MRILGIDPGTKGALALLVHGDLVAVRDMPIRQHKLAGGQMKSRVDTLALAALLREFKPQAVFLEQVNSHAGEGPMGAFAFGRGVGTLEGALGAFGLQAFEVPPANWKRAVGVRKGPDGDVKGPAKAKAAELWPALAGMLQKARADKSEAALIAWYGHLQLQGL